MQQEHILSINFNHDGSAVILSHGNISAFLNTERFSKKKKHPGIRREDLDHLLNQAGLTLRDIGLVILCNINNMDSPDIPHLYGTTLKETWLKLWVNQTQDQCMIDDIEIPCLVNPPHYLLHCALAYYTSPFDEAISFSWDPTGWGVYIGRKNKFKRVDYQLKRYNTCAWYALAAQHLFGTGIIGAGKVMGLAPYGEPAGEHKVVYGQVTNMQEVFAMSVNGHASYVEERGEKLNATIAYHAQQMMEFQLAAVFGELHEICREHGIAPNICLGGGGALNSVANQVAFEQSRFEKIHIHPASGDDGTAMGAALYYWYDQLNNEKKVFSNREIMYSVATYEDTLGQILSRPEYQDKLVVEQCSDYIEKTAQYIAENKIIGWFQGPSEIGPRSLGNRSILADPRNPDMKEVLNRKIKFRENFRPFAPSVLNEHAEEWFGLKDSPFMLRVCKVLSENVPSVSHVDQTARIQTVSREDNASFYQLIKCFYEITGVPVLINTSFNTRGEPIVETPQDGLDCFLNNPMDVLVFKNMIIRKKADLAVAD
jgi:carbamoyltransferase